MTLKVTGTTKLGDNSYIIDTISFKDKDGNTLDSTKLNAQYDKETNTISINIINDKLFSDYSVKLVKVSEDGETNLSGSKFNIWQGTKPTDLKDIAIPT